MKFDVINKLFHAEVNQAYPTCAFIKFIFGVTFFWPLATNLGLKWETEINSHVHSTCVCE